ncbi:cop9 signalosome complex subunit, partial [Massospora cicadina]
AAKELSTTVPVIQAELCSLISEGLLSARMDFESKVLWSKKVDPRTQVLQKVQKLGQDYQRQVRITLGLVRLQQAELK